MNPCLTVPSGCQWPTNGGDKAIVESIIHYMEKPGVQQPGSIAGIQGPGAVLNVTAYIVAMNICESLKESQYHCHWIPKSFVTGELCVACPAICRGVGHTLNFIQFIIGAIIFQISYPISRVAIVMVLSDVVSKDYQVGQVHIKIFTSMSLYAPGWAEFIITNSWSNRSACTLQLNIFSHNCYLPIVSSDGDCICFSRYFQNRYSSLW